MTALDRLVDATPDSRDRVVDLARGLSILVVVLWHWVFSVTFRTEDAALAMSNPVHVVPGGRWLTWVFQVMPVFILAGGYVNLLGWGRAREAGAGAARFVASRLRRLLVPTGVWATVWLCAEVLTAAVRPGHRWMWEWFPGYLAPLWFLAVYALLIAVAPLTATLHERHGPAVLAGLVALIGVGTALDRVGGLTWAAWVSAALVWVFAHQLGHAWCSWDPGHRPLPARLVLAGVGLAGLVALTTLADYPVPMVGTEVTTESNIFPTNATIAALVVFQLGLLAVATPALERLLARRRVWKPVVALNAVAMTIFVWHMTAFLLVILAYEGLGEVLLDEPTASWWWQRWLWLLAPAAILTVLIAIFGRVEFLDRGRGGVRTA